MGNEKFLKKLITEKQTTVFDRTLDTLIALLPAAIAGCIYFGFHALLLMLGCMLTAVVSAFTAGKFLGVAEKPGDLSAAVCGLLVAMTMPSGFSIPAAAVCAAIAVVVPRMMFGGVECEVVSPAAFGAVMAFLCFPSLFYYNEAFTGNFTPYVPFETSHTIGQLLFGARAGAIGETPALFLILGGVYLVIRRIITVTIPICSVAFTALWALLFGMDIKTALLGGGLLLVAIYILPERQLCPHSFVGKIAYCLVFAFLCTVLRKYAAPDEGVYFAVLCVNLIRPLFDAIPFLRRGKDE